MAGAGTDDERDAVLETVRAWLTSPEDEDEHPSIGGLLAEWLAIRGPSPWSDLYDIERTVEWIELRELGETRAVVDARGAVKTRVKRGTYRYETTIEGPIILEKVRGDWRIVDFVENGRRRSDAIVIGPLAEQHRTGVTARVLGIDRAARLTLFAVELLDTGAEGVRLKHAFALVEHQALWERLSFAAPDPVAPGGARTVLLQSNSPLALDETVLAVALDVRTHAGRQPFIMQVPVVAPDELVPTQAPRRLPPLRQSHGRTLVPWVALAAFLAWWGGWFALAVPVLYGTLLYINARIVGRLPARLEPVRFAADVAVVVAGVLALWFSPAIYFAVPWLVAALAFVSLRRLGLQTRYVAAAIVGAAWLFLLGTAQKPLSPCRLVGGSPAAVADAFTRALYSGRVSRAAGYEVGGFDPFERQDATSIARERVRTYAIDQSRSPLSASDPFCRFLRKHDYAVACYLYVVPSRTKPSFGSVAVGVGCQAPNWRVEGWT